MISECIQKGIALMYRYASSLMLVCVFIVVHVSSKVSRNVSTMTHHKWDIIYGPNL